MSQPGSRSPRHLLVLLQRVNLLSQPPPAPAYLSFSLADTLHMSSCLPSTSGPLNDDILIPVPSSGLPDHLAVHRWQNHMLMFRQVVEIEELRVRGSCVRRVETRAGELVTMVVVAVDGEVVLGPRALREVTQHYLVVEGVEVLGERDKSVSYVSIRSNEAMSILPVTNAQTVVKLPTSLELSLFKDGKQVGRSRRYQVQDLQNDPILELAGKNGSKEGTKIKVRVAFGVNLLQPKPEMLLMMEQEEIILYDIEVKFEGSLDQTTRMKFTYGNKCFELGSESAVKSAKIKKIVSLTTKPDYDQVHFILEKNLKTIAHAQFLIQEIPQQQITVMRKKIIDGTGKVLGHLKFRCEKSRNVHSMFANKAVREAFKNKVQPHLQAYVLQQFSVKCQENQPLCLVLRTQSEQKIINNICNLSYLSYDEVSLEPELLQAKNGESIYVIVKKVSQVQSSDFIGISFLNPNEHPLSSNCLELKLFKNQTLTCTLNCRLYRLSLPPVIKPSFQPEMLQSGTHRSVNLSVVVREVTFSPYFYTYKYDNKNEVYCIVEINRVKKVLIMENKQKNDLSFTISASSDNLDFSVEEAELIRLKVTFLVSDIGQEQQIYGWCFIKIKLAELEASTTGLKFYLVDIKNDFGNKLGQINIEVHKASLYNSYVKQSRDVLESGPNPAQADKRKVKMHMAKVSQSQVAAQKTATPNKQKEEVVESINSSKSQKKSHSVKVSARYDKKEPPFPLLKKKRSNSIMSSQTKQKLPPIREETASPQKNSLNELMQMMKVRKRSVKGHYEENSLIQSYRNRGYLEKSNSPALSYDSSRLEMLMLKDRIEKQNPNIERNLQILFPKKPPRREKSSSLGQYSPIVQEEQKLKGLKSVLQDISKQMGEIEPTVKGQSRRQERSKDSNRSKRRDSMREQKMQGPEWQHNQFLM